MFDLTLVARVEEVLGVKLNEFQIKYLLGDKDVDIRGKANKILMQQVKLILNYRINLSMVSLQSGEYSKGVTGNTKLYVKTFLELRDKFSNAKFRVCKIK